MSFFSWLASAIGNRRSAIGSDLRKPKPCKRFRPQLEALEDRTLLSTYSAATASDLIADINAANKAGGANTIALTAPATSPYVPSGLFVAKKDSLTIVGNGDTIDANHWGRLFDVASGASLTLQNVTLQNGYAYGSGVSGEGGAIYNQGTLTLTGVTVQSNVAQ